VLRVQRARFSVDLANMPLLMMDPDGPALGSRDPEPVAEGVEDLQIALGVDLDGNGGIDLENGAAGNDDEWVFNHPDDSAPPLITAAPYRAIRLTLTGRSVDETTAVATSLRPPAEDREGATVADVFRRRSLSTTIEIRNLAGSP
jgi:Type IV Pilus-assembly protein W